MAIQKCPKLGLGFLRGRAEAIKEVLRNNPCPSEGRMELKPLFWTYGGEERKEVI